MSFSAYIAQRLDSAPSSTFVRLVTRIAIGSIALGLAVILMAHAIFLGFRQEVIQKIVSIAGHIQITKYDLNNSYQTLPLSTQWQGYQNPKQFWGVQTIQGFSQKAALLYTAGEVQGLMIKGIGPDYDSTLLCQSLQAGRYIRFDTTQKYGRDLLISQYVADQINLQVGDQVNVMFVQDPPRYNRLRICGIYQTGIEQFDQLIAWGDHRLLQYLNNWEDSLAGGYEVILYRFDDLPKSFAALSEKLPYDLWAMPVTEQYREFFDWFVMLERNVLILMSVILVVVIFNTISVILILITERTRMIGMLKALGATNAQIQRIFFYKTLRITTQGLFWGNLIGLGFCWIEDRLRWIPLDPTNYYLDAVPIGWDIPAILGFNLLMLALLWLMVFLPLRVILGIRPVAAIRFD
ncbi:MAG: ABC transporter permease [Bernardetiaceae bacterium]